MNKEEAATILGVSPNSSTEEIRSRYQDLHSDYQIRLTNAPTPNLRKAYQKNLQEIREAVEVLSPGMDLSTMADLPASEPVRTSGPVGARSNMESKTIPARPVAKVEAEGLPRSTIIGFVLATIFAAIASLFFLKWESLLGLQDALTGSVDDLTHKVSRLSIDSGNLERTLSLLQNGRFAVCNQSMDRVQLGSLTVTYRDSKDHYRTFNTAFHDYASWEIPPGGSKALDFRREGDVVWDGSVIFYSMTVTARGNEYLMAGAWNEIQGNCVKLTF